MLNAAFISSTIARSATLTTFFIVSQAELTTPEIASHTDVKIVFTPSQAADMTATIAPVAIVTTAFKPSHTVEKNEVIKFHTVSKTTFIAVQPACHSAESPEKNALTRPLIAVRTPETIASKYFQTPEKMSLIPSQSVSQSPVNTPLKTLMIPDKMSTAACRTEAIYLKAPSRIGARKLQNCSQIIFIPATTTSNNGFKASSKLEIVSHRALNAVFTFSQISMHLFLKSSLVFQR